MTSKEQKELWAIRETINKGVDNNGLYLSKRHCEDIVRRLDEILKGKEDDQDGWQGEGYQ